MKGTYLETARLLVQIAPHVVTPGIFALKGGTAINLFERDMPRLSVDLDLVLQDHTLNRDQALVQIESTLGRSMDHLGRMGYAVRKVTTSDGNETKLLVRRDSIEVKVEANFAMRGTILPVRSAGLTPKASEALAAEVEIPVLAADELYGSKLVAAMDRQHPRDLFDVMQLFDHGGITPAIRRAFVVYLAGHNRPMHEILFTPFRDIEQEFRNQFEGMTSDAVAMQDLVDARERMAGELQSGLDDAERTFLLTLASNTPDWNVLGIPHLVQLPAIRWKLRNLGRLQVQDPQKFAEQHDELARRLDGAKPSEPKEWH